MTGDVYVPFLVFKCNEGRTSAELELACAFLYFEAVKMEGLKGLFSKQPKEKIAWVARGYYPLKAVLCSEGLYCVIDSTGITNSSIELGGIENHELDIKSVESLNIKDKAEAIKAYENEFKKNMDNRYDGKHMLIGYRNMGDILKGTDMDVLMDRSIEMCSCCNISEDIHELKSILNKAEDNIEYHAEILKAICGMDDENYKKLINEKNVIYNSYKDRIYETDKDVNTNLEKYVIDKVNRIKEIEHNSIDRIAFVSQELNSNKNKYDVASLHGNENEMNIYKKSMTECELKLEAISKETEEEIKKAESYYDDLIENEKKRISNLIAERDKSVKDCICLYDKLHLNMEDLKKSISDSLADKKKKISTFKEWMGVFDPGEGICEINIHIPFYAAEYNNGSGIKYRFLFPQVFKDKKQVDSLYYNITGKVPYPFSDRDKLFDDIENGLKEWLKNDENKKSMSPFAVKNLNSMDGMEGMVECGLKLLVSEGRLSDKSCEMILNDLKHLFDTTME